ncbi:carbohydrate-binding protein [Modestobacter sp. L9-4]|uniref:TIM-barrel domain-containing protein n=1 Tax=Modestobacter sp. L9-4 TaxID=2851567 RepID=UPI001C7733DC|nr:TIM-barrel domain-containing protein [Modestobacter sp. L9-4]QXG77103.1 carbohydrate-binding protein [Modestobacter sp. L9-4]
MESSTPTRRRHRWRRLAAVPAALVAAGVVVTFAPAPAATAAPTPRPVTPISVVSGQARFEILSPTLVRTEFAGDSRFIDAPTFNAIGRNSFQQTAVRKVTKDGWMTLDTGAMTLRYKVGSGRFTDDNLTIQLRTGKQDVTGAPWAGKELASCDVGVLCEAEDLTLDSVGVAADHSGYTGTGFAAGFEGTSTSLSFATTVAKAGPHQLGLRYANGLGDARTLTLTVDGASPRQLTLPPTGNWDTWAVLPVDLDLTAGQHTLALTHRSADTGQVNVDSLALVTPGTAYPAATVVCDFDALCEAEDLALSGRMHTATDHSGYTGRGFAAGYEGVGDSATFSVDAPAAGDYDLTARYARGFAEATGVSVAVTGGATTPFALPSTGSWDTWGTASVRVHLAAGTNQVSLLRTDSDAGNVNVDSLTVGPIGSGLGTPAGTAAADCAFGTICEAESGALSAGARPAADHNGYSGTGFTAGLDVSGAAETVHVVGVPKAGTYALQLRYADALATAGSVTVQAGTGPATPVALPPTSSWDSWRTLSTPVVLAAGDNDVRLSCPAGSGCGANLDTVAVTATTAPLLAPHAALGGYRRSLDGIDGRNGNPTLNPGLLYQDGWSLLDDTTSALYDQATRKTTPRPTHGAGGYQDGYVFGYGQDYQKALGELATLTGPSMLLPRWTYGVWYSEYLDRTAADFQDKVLPAFRANNVPLDSLVVDTDFKAVNTWNGWEFDQVKFPDPKGFFDWAKAQGLHTSLNVHPSIDAKDPQLAQALATSKNKLTKRTSGCSGGAQVCYTFDFGDPDQLKAYLQLHDQMQAAGPDVWWLDWCCDSSESNLEGVTGDAWINQAYADYSDSRLGRGFAFSRAFGSLQAGGYGNATPLPTGPWADKRTTLPFTGDTTSTWDMLAAEVGFTSGQSAATGLSPISHDIGGHNGGQYGLKGSETVDGQTTDKLPDDLYARWVQFGTFQPIDRLHSNHGDRLPWQYPGAGGESAADALRLREALVPYTYTLARQAETTGVPVVRAPYLQYPGEQEAYATAGTEYLYGSDVLVAPVVKPGTTATTRVWFPPNSTWTDWFTGKTYAGGTTADVVSGLDTMPVFVKSGGIVATRTNDVANDAQNPLTELTVTVGSMTDAAKAKAEFQLFEDDGTTDDRTQSRTTAIRSSVDGKRSIVHVSAPQGRYTGAVTERAVTVRFLDAHQPTSVMLNGATMAPNTWTFDATTHVLTVTTPKRPVTHPMEIAYR